MGDRCALGKVRHRGRVPRSAARRHCVATGIGCPCSRKEFGEGREEKRRDNGPALHQPS
jgi:hypothetical protein